MSLVDMLVANEMLDALPDALPLLKARERAHRPAQENGYTVVTLEIDGAPDGVRRIEPIFSRDGAKAKLTHMNWQYT
ncbi:hypothetical protein ACWGVR_14340 [Streptomyces xanthophaeus]